MTLVIVDFTDDSTFKFKERPPLCNINGIEGQVIVLMS